MTYPIYYLKRINKGKVVSFIRTSKKRRISRSINLISFKTKKFDTIYLQIRYSKDYTNEGSYTNKKDLKIAYHAFLEVINEF
jgi:hypothetical protein